MKKLWNRIQYLFWRIQFRKETFNGRTGYHCRECDGGNGHPYCGDFYPENPECPCKPGEVLIYRFK